MLNNQIWNVNKSHINARPIILIVLILENAKIMKRNNNVHVLFQIKIDNVATSGAKSCKWIEGKCIDKSCEDFPNN